MVNRFTFWLEGIVEDDPLPTEIKNIVFVVKHNGKYKYLEMQGYEKEISPNAIFYRPLEAEFFSLKELSLDGENLFEYKVKTLIDEAFFSPSLKQQFAGRKIYFLNRNLQFLFIV